MKTCYMMIGVPGSGKSTYIEEIKKNEEIVSLSTDEYIENKAKSVGLTYTDVYQDSIKDATKWFNQRVQETIKNNQNFIWDQTNLNKKSRKYKIELLKKNQYKIIGVYFEVDRNILVERLDARYLQTGKKITVGLLDQMLSSYEKPIKEEGFDIILKNNGFGIVKDNKLKNY